MPLKHTIWLQSCKFIFRLSSMNNKQKGNPEVLTNINFLGRIDRRSLLWMVIAGLVIVLSDILPSSWLDKWYYNGIFGWFRGAYDFLLSWSPIPMIYIVLSVIIVRIARWISEFKKGFIYTVSKALGGIAFLIILFYLLWGFNYNQMPLQDRLGFDINKVSQ